MPKFEKIKSFLNDLSAVSGTHYQIWNSNANLVFSTQAQQADEQTKPLHLQLVQKSILADAYTYAPIEQKKFLCGLPMEIDQRNKGIVLAFGAVPLTNINGEHPVRMKALLHQVLQFGQKKKQAGNNGDRAQSEQADQKFEDLYLFANISKQFRSLRLKQPVLDKLMQRILNSMGVDVAFLRFLHHPHYNHLACRPGVAKGRGESKDLNEQLEQIITAGIELVSGNYCIVDDSKGEDSLKALSDHAFKFMAVGVRHTKNSYGWLGMISYGVNKRFRVDALNIMQTLANQLAAMIANMDQYDDLERFTINIVCSLVNAIESKDVFFRGHSKRVHKYVMQMAKHLQLSAKEREALKWASVLHDIGKISIPERILRKPDRLTKKEFDLIKQHPLKGKKVLEPIKQLQPSMDAIAYHHERFDGTGYPDGLKGKAIPLAARIIAVADAFDAITSKRSYHRVKTRLQALKELDQVAGTQLDPRLVKVFKTACSHLLDDEYGSEDAEDSNSW